MSWRDDFNGSLDTSKFGTSVSGDGAVAVSGGTLNITMGTNAANAAIVYLKDSIVSNVDYAYTVRHKIDGTLSGAGRLFELSDGVPACDTNTNYNPKIKVGFYILSGTPNAIYLYYKNSAGTPYYWSAANRVWQTTSAAAFSTILLPYWIDVSFMVRGGKFRFSARIAGGCKSAFETDWVAFSTLQAYTTLYAWWGEILTNFYYVTSMKTDYVFYSSGTITYLWYDGTIDGSAYKIGRAFVFDDGVYHRDHDSATRIISLTGETSVYVPYVITVGGTLYMFYTVLRNADPYNGKYRIRYATSTNNGDTWTDQGYITTPTGTGWEQNGHYGCAANHDGTTWRLYIGGVDASGNFRVGYFYGAALNSLTDYASNPILALGSSGAWNDKWEYPNGLDLVSNLITLYTAGNKASTGKWQGGAYTSSDWINFTPDGSNPTMARDATKATTASNASAGDTALTVADSSVTAIEHTITIGDASHREVNRVLGIPDGTHITLYYPTLNSYTTPTVGELESGSVFFSGATVGALAFPTNNQSTALLLELIGYWTKSGSTWAITQANSPVLSAGPTGDWDENSAESPSWIHTPFTLTTTVDVGLQSGAKTLFSVSENTDQILSQNLISKGKTLLPPSFVLDHILTQNLQSGNKTIFPASNVTDQILSQNLLSSIISVLSALASTDQILSVGLIGSSGSPYDVTVVFPTVGITVNLGLLLGIFSALSASVKTDQILNQNSLSILATLHHILVEIIASLPENFGYQRLKAEAPSPGVEGSPSYQKIKADIPNPGVEGDFKYKKVN